IDTATGLLFTGTLKAAPGSTVLSPLTTLIAEVAAQPGFNVATATQQVVTSLGLVLPPGVDPNTFDPIAAAASTTGTDQAVGAALFAAGVQVYNTIVQAASLLTGAGANADAATSAVMDAIVNQIAAPNSSVDLSNTTQLTTVINDAANTTVVDVSTTAT